MDRSIWLLGLRLRQRARSELVRRYLEQGWFARELLEEVSAADTGPDPDAVVASCRQAGIRWVTPFDPEYPRSALLGLHDPPPVLFLRGREGILDVGAAVAIVGARRGTARGRRCATLMGAELARADVRVVSGLALGVDAAAHVGCLEAGGTPVAVLPRGLDRSYPERHERLLQRVVHRGVAVSEYPPGLPARKEHFVARNRLVAALAPALLVVEAGGASGALHTVDFAQQLGREVFAVPGPVDCPHSEGTLSLLRDGATLVRHAADLLDSLGLRPVPRTRGPLGLTEVPESAVEIARRLGWLLPRVLAALGEAEVLGLVERAGGQRWVRASALPPDHEPT